MRPPDGRRLFFSDSISILPQAEFGPNDHREDAPFFRYRYARTLL